MFPLLLATLCAAQPGVVIGVGNRGSVLQVARAGKPSGNGLLGVPTDLVMLTDVIAPTSAQRQGGFGQQFTLDVALGETITFEKREPEPLLKALGGEEEVTLYGRVRVGKAWLHETLLRAGWAWVLPAARKDAALVKLEEKARAARRGLWADEAPVEPWL